MKESEAVCPYCHNALVQLPKQKNKCPFCEQFINVRTLPTTRERILVTEADAIKIDQEWKQIQFRKRWMGKLAAYGITEQDFTRHKAMLSQRFGREAWDHDVLWAIFNNLLTQKMKTQDFHQLKVLYYSMALFLNEEGKDWFKVLQQSSRMELLYYKQSRVVKNVQILTTRDACEACQLLANQVWSIDEALKQMPIPVKGCTRSIQDDSQGFCRCRWNAMIIEHPHRARALNFCPRCGDPVHSNEYFCDKCGLKLRERHW
ncbi:MAG: hypothetical protein ACE5R6_21070 [Candidatus Heimdallarchaeota archaeon]